MFRFGSSMNQNGILTNHRRLFDHTPGYYGGRGYQSHGRRAYAIPQQTPIETPPAFDLDWYPMDVWGSCLNMKWLSILQQKPIKCWPLCNMKRPQSTGFCFWGEDIIFVYSPLRHPITLFFFENYNTHYLKKLSVRWYCKIRYIYIYIRLLCTIVRITSLFDSTLQKRVSAHR